MKHLKSPLRYSRYILALVFATAFSFGARAQFMSIFGPTCVDAGVQYQYALTGDYPGMGINWCVTGGTIQGGTGNCRYGTNLKNVFVTWTSGTGRSLTATITSGGTGSATTNVTVTAALVAGTISNTSQLIAYGATPTTLSCSIATGGHCSPSYNYQWLSSSDNVTFDNLPGATSQNLVFSEGLTQTTYFKRKVTESTSGSIGYSNTATVNVNPPPIVPGNTSPATQMVNTYTTMPPMTLVTQPATLATCPTNDCFLYQWEKSTNGTTWDSIIGATGLTYNPGQGMPTVTTQYRTRIKANGQIAYSPVVSIQSQSSVITGSPDCWKGQTVTYYYTGGNPNDFLWTIPLGSGTIIGPNTGVGSVTIKWPNDGTFILTLYNQTTSTTIATLNIYVHTIPLNPGKMGKLIQSIETTSSASFSPFPGVGAIGGNCNGIFAYQWQRSTDSVTYTNLSGQTSLDLAVTPTVNAYYRRRVICGTDTLYTDTSYVQLYPYFNPGTATALNADSVGWNTYPDSIRGSLPNGGIDTTYKFQWEYSTDQTNYFEVESNGQGISYKPERLATTTWFRRRVLNGVTIRYTNAAKVKVKILQFYTGLISPPTKVINSGANAGTLTGTAATGGTVASYKYRWQRSYDEVNWESTPGNDSAASYAAGVLTKTTYFRRRATNGPQAGFANTGGAFIYVKVKVLPTGGGVNIPSTATQATSDPGINPVNPNAYTLSGISNGKVNYVRSWDVEMPGVTTLSAAKALSDPNEFNQNTGYLDDFGRPIQSVAKQATPNQKDLVAGIVNYDILGRTVQEYLPYTDGTNTGNLKTDHTTKQSAFYNGYFNNTESFYHSNAVYEKSPLNRVLKATAAGKSFTGSNIGVRSDYSFNMTIDSVKYWTIGNTATDAPVVQGDYAAGALVLVTTTDEHENKVMEYKDKEGKVILKKVQLSDTIFNGYQGWLSTFYIYDVFGRLRYVLSPKAVEYARVNAWALSQTVRDELCFRYFYDESGRMVIKKVPGAGEVQMVYDSRDRLVMTQDSLLRAGGKWLYTQYDSLNRATLTGIWANGNNRAYHQGQAASVFNYPNPGSNYEVLTQNYYDDYTWVSGTGSGLATALITTNISNTTYFYTPTSSYPYPQAVDGDKHTQGVPTGTKTKVLGTSTYLYSVSFIDKWNRVVQVQSTNLSGGKDTVTTQYDFSGKVLRNLIAHAKAGTNTQYYKIGTKNEYDHAGRLLKVSKKTGNSPEVVITENVYDELGQLTKKSIGRKRDGTNQNTYTTDPIDTLRYSYNIRGWLRGINKDYARNENSAQNWFGMELAYDFGFNAKQFNGNIAGMRWRSKGDGEERAYGFGYDNVNRLLRAEFTQNNGGWNTTAKVDYTMKMGNGTSPYTAYDANGNILGMIQRGLKLNASPTIDSLRYGYDANTNKLNYVTDIANDTNTRLGDFKEINNNTSQDYTYDGNGNMTIDNNKAIASITYNHLNLPNVITITGKGTITYTYDAAGNKLKKETVDNTVVLSKTTTTLYSGTNIYQNDTIQFILHEEGRVRPIRPGYTDTMYYDYFEKDHLGNVRVVLTDELKQDIYPAATLEGTYSDGNTAVGYEKNFYTIDQSKIVDKTTATGITDYVNHNYDMPSPYPDGNSGNTNYSSNSEKLYRLQATAVTNGGVNGLGMTLKVMSGDRIDIMGKSYYFTNNTGGNNYNVPVADIIAGLLGATGGAAGLKGFTSTDLNGQTAITTPISNFLSDAGRGTGTVPKAYINWILFDENFKYVSGNFSRVGTQNVVKDHYGDAQLQNILVNKNGYLYVYVSNQSPVAVFFDNLQVVHTRGPLLEETHYYPFGLTMAGISSKAFGNVSNKIQKFQGQEIDEELGLNWYGFKWRNHDFQIGRFIQIDPLTEKYLYNSPFAFSENKVTSHVELEGLESISANVASHYKEFASRNGINFKNSIQNGMINNPLVTQKQIAKLERGESSSNKEGIVLHRTVSSNSEGTLNSFSTRGVGTHFLVGSDGTIYQTASLDKKTSHIREDQVTDKTLTNANTIGIEVVGNYNAETKQWDPVTNDQAQSVGFLVNSLLTTFGLTNDRIFNHEQIQPKTAGEGQTVYDAIFMYLRQENNFSIPGSAQPYNQPTGTKTQ